uniref:F-box domain-containing protein n=1 Tax=Parastrongyloides trichosuri TaxID=131310 RepID=A0A0N4Z968_PARTI
MLKFFKRESSIKKSTVNKRNSVAVCTTNNYSQYIPKHQIPINTIEDISDKCIIEILRRMDSKSILNMKLVNKRINTIIKRHYNEFSMTEIEDLILVGNEDYLSIENYCYRLSESNFFIPPEECTDLYVPMSQVHKKLYQARVTNSTTFVSLQFSNECHRVIQSMCESSLDEITLDKCFVTMNFEIFSRLIREFLLSKITIKDCLLDDCQLLCDNLFITNQQIQKFKFYSTEMDENIHAPLLSNKTLTTWADNTSWPDVFILQNVKSTFTYNGISILLNAFHQYSSNINDNLSCTKLHNIYWDFGFINCQLSQLIAIVRKFNPWIKYIKRSPNQIAFTYRFSKKTSPLNFNVRICM